MFIAKLYITLNLLFIVKFSFQNNLQKQTIIFDLDFQRAMNSFEFKEIIVFKDFEVKNGVLGLERNMYLSIVKFLD
jgi:hypothetical protein